MLNGRDPNGPVSGRTSRASNMSGVSRVTNKHAGDAGGGGSSNPRQDLLASAGPGIYSMLRTSTEMGNVGSLNDNLSGFGHVSRHPQRRGASSRLSTTSSVSNQSNFTQRHRHHPSSSSAPRGSMHREPLPLANVPYVPDTRSPTMMNVSGSSPSVPLIRSDRDSQRSMSITHSMPLQPDPRLTNNRSMGSLRGHDPHYRSNSPMAYPTRFGPQGHRAASPAWSNMPGQNPRRVQTQGGRGQPCPPGAPYSSSGPYPPGTPHYAGQQSSGPCPPAHIVPGQSRQRLPSDASLARSERSRALPRRRGSSRAPYSDDTIPPMPPLHQSYYPFVEQARRLNSSVIESGSSSSFNVRTDSDTPSSDLPLPLTPRNTVPMVAPGGYPHNQMRVGATSHVAREEVSSGPLYYDGSEQFEHEEYTDPMPLLTSTGFPDHVKASVVRAPCDTPSGGLVNNRVPSTNHPRDKYNSSGKTSLEAERTQRDQVAELPASPVVPRITRDLVKQALEPASTTGDIGSSISSPTPHGNDAFHRDLVTAGPMQDGLNSSSLTRIDESVSQVGSSVLNSVTVGSAKRIYPPAFTGTVPVNGSSNQRKPISASPDGLEKSTEDGMSELLAGYQHPDFKEAANVDINPEVRLNASVVANNHSERNPKHEQKSSDEQSFKSCTDVPEPASPESGQDEVAQSCNISIDVNGQLPYKDPYVQSIPRSKDGTASGDSSNEAPSRLPSTNLANLEPRAKTPASEQPSSSPIRTIMRKAVPRDASLSLVANMLRRSSRPSITQAAVPVSGSSCTLEVAQQPPHVPPRESSASNEAHRQRGVGSFLMKRWRRGKSIAVEEGVPIRDNVENVSSQAQPQDEERIERDPPMQQPQDMLKSADNEEIAPVPIAREQRSSPPVDFDSPSEPLRVGITIIPDLHQRALSSPPAGFSMPSSVYSPQDMSLKFRAQSSPAGLPLSPESSVRDSQSTTHLSWIGRRPCGHPSASVSEPHLLLPIVHDDSTTTDLRLSGYRYNCNQQRYLPDLKEESHEDSSLNTSAGNLKSSQFRFPHGGVPGVRAPIEDAVFLSRRSSTRSHRRSVLGEAHGLPCMEFSHNNLFEMFEDALSDIRLSRFLDLPGGEKRALQRSTSAGDREKTQNSVNLVGEAKGMRGSVNTTGLIDFAKLKRECPPELMAEIDRLSIPSVTQLTQRFTEMLPSLSLGDYYRQYEHDDAGVSVDSVAVEFPEEQEMMEHALESIHDVHPPSQKRSSARLRPMRGSSALVVVDDDVFQELTSKGRGWCGAGCDGNEAEVLSYGVGEAGTRANAKDKDVLQFLTRQLSPIAELQPPSPAVLRPRSHTAGNQHLRTSVESALSSRRSLRSFVSTPTATVTRPWNFDENYPWATATHSPIDISLPPPNTVKTSPRPGPSHLRNTLSNATTSTFISARTTYASPRGNASNSNADRQPHRLSIFGRSGDQAHAVGERYPTSALSPPTAIFRDNLSACDTSDDEDFTVSRKNRLSLRKRFSSAARNNTILHTPPRVTRSKVNPAELASPLSADENSSSTLQDRAGEAQAFTSNRHTFRDAEGMRASAYHRQRLIKTVKRLFHKGAELVRRISRRNNY